MFEIDFNLNGPFKLESGGELSNLSLRCSIYGRLDPEKSNAVLVFHALSGSSRIPDWWGGLIGEGKALDTSKYAFVCVNHLGSCYGSSSAAALKNKGATNNGKKGKGELPLVTIADMARANALLSEYLGISKFRAAIGGSVGGMLAMRFAADFPEMLERCIAIGAAPLSAMGLALNHLQRQALKLNDIELARKIAMISYKSAAGLDSIYHRKPNRNGEDPSKTYEGRYDIAGYLDYQGDIFRSRFEPESYQLITKAMDLFDLSDIDIRGISAKINLVGISSDWLFPSGDIEKLAARFIANGADAEFTLMRSEGGHDAFLSDIDKVSGIIGGIFKKMEEGGAALAVSCRG